MVQQLVWTPKQSAPKAFPERQALMPVWGGVPMPRPQWQNIWKKRLPHTPDAIVEVSGKLPNGKVGRGFYNFDHPETDGGVHGHIYYENCASIYLLERPFMGKATCSLNFINRNGGAMFKIFVGRDEAGELKQHQIEAMRKLFDAA